jgi:DNA-binding transcriptional regulator YiaG
VLKLRRRLGLSQAEFGKLAGVSTLTVGKWEKAGGRIGMRPAALAGLARVRAMGKRQIKVALTETASSGK